MNFDGSRGSALRAFVDFAIEEAGTPQPPPGDLRGISCIVCAYNEADRIRNILDVIVGHPTLGEVIVVNDGSTDETEALIRSYPTIRVLTHTPNRGKTYALSRGIAAARYDHLMLLDADLAGITAADIDALAAPVMRGEAEVSISLRSNSLWVYRQLGLDFVSGERVVPKWLLQSAVAAMQRLPRWGGEVFMNEIFIRHGLPHRRGAMAPGAQHPQIPEGRRLARRAGRGQDDRRRHPGADPARPDHPEPQAAETGQPPHLEEPHEGHLRAKRHLLGPLGPSQHTRIPNLRSSPGLVPAIHERKSAGGRAGRGHGSLCVLGWPGERGYERPIARNRCGALGSSARWPRTAAGPAVPPRSRRPPC